MEKIPSFDLSVHSVEILSALNVKIFGAVNDY